MFNSFARLKANNKVGSYLLFSMELIVCRETPHFLASSSCDSPISFRLIRIVFSMSATMFSFKVQQCNKINDNRQFQMHQGMD